jgi:hypothetical protein
MEYHTEISVLDVTARFSLRLNDVVALLCKVLDEEFLQKVLRRYGGLSIQWILSLQLPM